MEIFLLNFLILLTLLFLSAFFSGSEAALFSLKHSDLHRYSESNDYKEKLIFRLMNSPEKILITLLCGNLFVNIIITAISTSLLLSFLGEYGHFVAVILVSVIIIVIGEITPKVIAANNYESVSRSIIVLLKLVHNILFPLRVLLLAITNFIIKSLSLKLDTGRAITEEELDIAVKLGEAEGLINEGEKIFIDNVLRFSKKEAMNVMIPRNKALFIPYDTGIKTAMDIFLKDGTVRAPVYKDNFDNVVGMLDSRDLLPYVMGYRRAKNINRLLYDVYHYPASKELGELLSDFLKRKIQMAIVVDEYGGTAGVVSLKSILSELMGREFIEPEGSRRDDADVREIEGNKFVISGDMQIVDYNIKFNDSIESSESETIGGYIIEKLGHIPKRTEILETERNILTVRHIKKNRIESIELKMKERVIE